MPFRLGEKYGFRAKIQFTTSAAMPELIYRACLATGTVSGTVYCQRVLAEALARDLGLDLTELLADLPPPRGVSAHLFDPAEHKLRRSIAQDQSGGVRMTGPGNTHEEVR